MNHWHELTAIFGGTFDPPHLGHRIAIEGLFKNPGVRSVVVMPAAVPPWKDHFTPFEKRFEMAKRCFDGIRGVEISDFESSLSGNGPTYTFDTLMEFKRSNPKIAFVMGSDLFLKIEKWHRFPEILEICNWIVLRRAGADTVEQRTIENTLKEWQTSGIAEFRGNLQDGSKEWMLKGDTRLCVSETWAPQISSTDLRESFARSSDTGENMMPQTVIDYLRAQGLYGES